MSKRIYFSAQSSAGVVISGSTTRTSGNPSPVCEPPAHKLPKITEKKPATPEEIKEKVDSALRDLRKKPKRLSSEDLVRYRLRFISNSPYKVVIAAGYDLRPWEMNETPHGSWQKKENRVAAIKWMVEENLGTLRKNKGKTPEEIASSLATSHFRKYGLLGLLSHYTGSSYKAVHEAYGLMPWEMKHVPYNLLHEKDMRIKAVHWLTNTIGNKIGKLPEALEWEDFRRNHLGCLLKGRKRGSRSVKIHSVYELVCEAYPERNIKPWQMKYPPKGYFKSKSNRIEATKWLVETLKRNGELLEPCVIKKEQFKRYGLGAAVQNHKGGMFVLMQDADYEIDLVRRRELLNKIRKIKGSVMGIGDRIYAIRDFLSSRPAEGLNPKTMTTSDFFLDPETGFKAWYVVARYYDGNVQKALKELGMIRTH